MEIPHAKMLTSVVLLVSSGGFTWHIHEAMGNGCGRMGVALI
jgi:hypothetical protein